MDFIGKYIKNKEFILISLLILFIILVAIVTCLIRGAFEVKTMGSTGEKSIEFEDAIREICRLYTKSAENILELQIAKYILGQQKIYMILLQILHLIGEYGA